MIKINKLFSFLDTIGISYITIEHPPLFTTADAAQFGAHIPGAATKNLFLKDDSKQMWLISALESTTINLRALAKSLPAKNLRFAQPELLKEYLDVEPGSVTWFALLNDPQNRVNALLDKALFNHSEVGFHPLQNTATTVTTPKSLIRFAEALKHNYRIYDFSDI